MKTYQLTMLMAALTLLCTAAHGEEKIVADPALIILRNKIEQELSTLDPKLTFEIPESSAGQSLVVRYKTRQYTVHPKNKAGRVSEESEMQEGPSADGFLLRAHIQPLGEVNQAVVPRAYASNITPKIRAR